MFGIGFPELVVIAIVALVLVGPQRLPDLARQFGRFFVQIRRVTSDVRSSMDEVVRQAEDEFRQEEDQKLRQMLLAKTGSVHEAQARAVDGPPAAATHHHDPAGDSHSPQHHEPHEGHQTAGGAGTHPELPHAAVTYEQGPGGVASLSPKKPEGGPLGSNGST